MLLSWEILEDGGGPLRKKAIGSPETAAAEQGCGLLPAFTPRSTRGYDLTALEMRAHPVPALPPRPAWLLWY